MFTRLSKVVLWIGLIGCFIFSIMLGVSTQSEWGFWVTLGGWVATLVIFSGFGMIVELANNIKDSRDYLENISRNGITQSNNTTTDTSASYNLTSPAKEIKSSDSKPPVANTNNTPKNVSYAPWECPKCGHSNLGSYKFCEDCDARRPSNVPIQTSANNSSKTSKTFWTCPDCGSYVSLSESKCNNCGTPKP